MTWPDPPQIPPGGPKAARFETAAEILAGEMIIPFPKELPDILPRERLARLFDVPEELLADVEQTRNHWMDWVP